MPKTFLALIATLIAISFGFFWIPRGTDRLAALPQHTESTATTTAATTPTPAKLWEGLTFPKKALPQVATVTQSLTATTTATTTESLGRSDLPKSDTTATLAVGGAAYEVTAPQSVIEAMKTLDTSGDLTFTGRDYPSLGFFVESINGKKNENGHYWMLYVNGIESGMGASNTTLLPGDSVEWRYK